MCEIEINPERLKHFPKTVPMNIREVVLITAQALKRIYEAAPKRPKSLERNLRSPLLCRKPSFPLASIVAVPAAPHKKRVFTVARARYTSRNPDCENLAVGR